MPVVNVISADGFVIGKEGRKRTITLRRKEVLVNVETEIEKKAEQEGAVASPKTPDPSLPAQAKKLSAGSTGVRSSLAWIRNRLCEVAFSCGPTSPS